MRNSFENIDINQMNESHIKLNSNKKNLDLFRKYQNENEEIDA